MFKIESILGRLGGISFATFGRLVMIMDHDSHVEDYKMVHFDLEV
jgi:hypothetical protein